MNIDEILPQIPFDARYKIDMGAINRRVLAINSAEIDETCRKSFTSVLASDIDWTCHSMRNRFINAVLLADWACYSIEADRADFSRLSTVLQTFPLGFRLWLCRSPRKIYMPVGYTGWYSITKHAFDTAHDRPSTLTNRSELRPCPTFSQAGEYIWLFNYSIINKLHRSPQSKKMLLTYANELRSRHILGMAATVLSQEGANVATRFGLTYRGDMTHDGVSEKVFAVRL